MHWVSGFSVFNNLFNSNTMRLLKQWLILFAMFFFIYQVVSQPLPKKINTAEKLYSLAKMYGYIKYFYPGDEAASLDWNKFALHSSAVIAASSENNLRADLNDLFIPFAPAIQVYAKGHTVPKTNPASQLPVKPVYWQHLGDGKGSVGYPYKSMRINRPARVLPSSSNDFFALRKSINVQQLIGKEIMLTSRIKADPFYHGRPSVIIEIKEKDKNSVQTSSDGQLFSTDWNNHQVIKKVPDEAESINIYILNIGMAGSLFIDDIQLKVKEGNGWKEIESENFDTATCSDLIKKWQPGGPNHEIALVQDSNGQSIRISRTKGKLQKADPLFSYAPAENESKVKEIGSGLLLQLPLVLYADSSHTYPLANSLALSKLNEKLDKIGSAELKAENLNTRIANIIILWNTLQHFYPSFHSVKIDWKKQFFTAIARCYTDKTFEDHRRTLSMMVAPLNDSHMSIYYSKITAIDFYPPLKWEWIENKLVITAVLDSTLGIQRGDIVEFVDGIKASEFWRFAQTYVTGATLSRKNYNAVAETLKGVKGSVINITVNAKGKNKTLHLSRDLDDYAFDQQIQKTKPEAAFREIPGGIFYIDLTKISWADLQKKIATLAKAHGVIFDLRGYPQWQTIEVLSHYTQTPILGVQTGIPKIIYPDRENMRISYSTQDTLFPKQPFIQAKTVFLTNGRAISYSEDFLNMISFYKLAQIIGEPTAGITGITNSVPLLGGLFIPWTGMSVLKQNGKIFTSIAPDHEVKRTIKGIKEGRDEYIDYAMQNIFHIGSEKKTSQ
jgi:C-terminal processing protease CtpA/Prc